MSKVAKYNTYKGVSTVLTIGTPIATLACCGDFFKQRSETAISAAGVFVILFILIFCKDKIVENFKCPSALLISLGTLIALVMIENIITPIKYVCIATSIACGVDEVTFKNLYKRLEVMFPEQVKAYKRMGFIFARESTIYKEQL